VPPVSCVHDSLPHRVLQVSYKGVLNQVVEVSESQAAFLVQQEEVGLHFSKYFQT